MTTALLDVKDNPQARLPLRMERPTSGFLLSRWQVPEPLAQNAMSGRTPRRSPWTNGR